MFRGSRVWHPNIHHTIYKFLHTLRVPHGTLAAIWHLNPSLAFQASTDPVDTSAQAALAPNQTTKQEESADTTFMVT
jgi:hypothetical protein